MQLKPGTFCPLIKDDCVQLKCSWFTQVRGKNPNTGEEVDQWGCAMTWLPVMLIENAKESRQTGASVESFRNEMVRANQAALLMTAQLARNDVKQLEASRSQHQD